MPSHFTVLYDASVFYPAPLRDLLMELATAGLFRAKWSEQVQKEMLLMNFELVVVYICKKTCFQQTHIPVALEAINITGLAHFAKEGVAFYILAQLEVDAASV